MQELIQKLLAEHGPKWKELLGSAGFDAGQAERFLPASLQAVVDRVQGGKFDVKSLLGKLDVDALLGKLDLGALAKKAGVDEGLAKNGLTKLLPDVLQKLTGKGGLLEKLGGDAGGLLDKAKGFFG